MAKTLPLQKTMTIVSLNEQIGKNSQDVTYTELLRADGVHTLRIIIRSNSYRDQCYAKIERHDGIQWHEVDSLESSLMTTKEGLCYVRASVNTGTFMQDRNELVRHAELILNRRSA